MGRILALILLLTVSWTAIAAGNCPVVERELIGAWSRGGDSGFFEEFSLAVDSDTRTFSSWLHKRPELSGATWTLKNCELIVTPQRGEFDALRFKVLGLERGKLRLYDEADHIESVYVRLPDEP